MNYTNQRDHPLLDRQSIRDLLLDFASATVEASPTEKPRSEHLKGLMNLAGSELERQWLLFLEEHKYRLPSKAQVLIGACKTRPDFLYEKEQRLGGAMLLAAMVKGFDREDILGFVSYLETQIAKLGVDIRSGQEVDKSVVEEVKPDVLVIAVGGSHNAPDLPGINKRHVITSKSLHRRLKGAQFEQMQTLEEFNPSSEM